MEVDRSKPIRNGDVYCAPRCGCKCKWADYEKAVADSNSLAQRMGRGWKPRVWENMGWHWSVEKGSLELSGPPRRGRTDYMVMFHCKPQVIVHHEFPEQAVRLALIEAGNNAQAILDCVEESCPYGSYQIRDWKFSLELSMEELTSVFEAIQRLTIICKVEVESIQ